MFRDIFRLTRDRDIYALTSVRGQLRVTTLVVSGISGEFKPFAGKQSVTWDSSSASTVRNWMNESRSSWAGYEYRVTNDGPNVKTYKSQSFSHYWLIVLPLTILSAYLSLSKPRSKSVTTEIDHVCPL